MYDQEFQGDVLYMMLYAVVAVLNISPRQRLCPQHYVANTFATMDWCFLCSHVSEPLVVYAGHLSYLKR